jgi:hypothetical protein
LQWEILKIVAADTPQGRLWDAEGVFPNGFTHHVEDSGPSHHLLVISIAGGEASAAGGSDNQDRKGVDYGGKGTGTSTMRKKFALLRTPGN